MIHTALTARYRPQLFSEVAGQETVTTILSRAALEDRVAPAYLFSGTRGVGKTTLARIFAKALNCRNAPAAEPCNTCGQCRAVTAGSSADVVEIDGASNRGIDDMRKLREVVGYAPMEGRYRIFIIDEAHMLSREAFNALLKTLEEPPPRVTFILATTEAHKFPATIISRCQHYVFKRLPENGLTDHIRGILQREGVDYEEGAARLLARRGAGSVRDAMSLLGQVLALGEGRLTEAAARRVLGLAGQESFGAMLDAFRDGDCLKLSALLREMLDQGLDVGFFLRELTALWRNLFILRQAGEAALPAVDLPEDEACAYLAACGNFSLPHIHACWQMTLEGQRRILSGMEPAPALELLLFNLAMLPRLLSLENLSAPGRKGIAGAAAPAALPRPAPQPASAPLAASPPPSVPMSGPSSDPVPAAPTPPSSSLPAPSADPAALAASPPLPAPLTDPMGGSGAGLAASFAARPSLLAPVSGPSPDPVPVPPPAPSPSADPARVVPLSPETPVPPLVQELAGRDAPATLAPVADTPAAPASAQDFSVPAVPFSPPAPPPSSPEHPSPQAPAATPAVMPAANPLLLVPPPAGSEKRRGARAAKSAGTAKKKDKGDKKAVMEHPLIKEVQAHFGDAYYVEHGRR
ncbi:MAG: DNA polymerase III subunit gamma/tau [Desulfovibrio sp.]|nr:DNA polymerase III subunit gamma/tau [Desulfovibrio sp.]